MEEVGYWHILYAASVPSLRRSQLEKYALIAQSQTIQEPLKLWLTRIVKTGISREHEQATRLVPPPDDVLTHDGLHDGVETSLGRVQVARHLSLLDLGGEGGSVRGKTHVMFEPVGRGTALTGLLEISKKDQIE